MQDHNIKIKVAIVGGGIAGLTVAHELAIRSKDNNKYEITVYEKNDILGGKARSMLTEEGLPSEHSVRTISATYYHLRETLSRIPKNISKPLDCKNNLLTNVVATPQGPRKLLFFQNFNPFFMPTYFPIKFSEVKEYFHFLKSMSQIIPFKEICYFVFKLIYASMICDKRRIKELQNQSWANYLYVENKSKGFKQYLMRLPEYFTGAKEVSSADPISIMIEKGLFIGYIHPIKSRSSTTDIFNAPSSEAFIDPWGEYLKTLNVRFEMECEINKININENKICSIIGKTKSQSRNELIEADIYLFAVPIEKMTQLVDDDIKKIAPSLDRIAKLNSEMASGIQFFNTNTNIDVFPQGWSAFMDSPWSLVGLYQSQKSWQARELPNGVKGILSLAIGNFDAPGIVHNKPTVACTKKEIKEEVIAQLKLHKGTEFMNYFDLHSWALDPELEFKENNGPVAKHNAPLFIQLPHYAINQPDNTTEIENLFLAGDYVKTVYNLVTMEAANESGKRAANAILSYTHNNVKKCKLESRVRTGFLLTQKLDSLIFYLTNLFRK